MILAPKSEDDRGPSVFFLVHREGLGPIFSSVYVNPAERLVKLGIDAQILLMSSAGEFVKPALRRRWKQFAGEIRNRVPRGVTRLPSPPHSMRWLSTDRVVLNSWAALNLHSDGPLVLHCGGGQAANLALGLRRRHPNVRVVYHCWGPEAAEVLYPNTERPDGGAPPDVLRLANKKETLQARAMHESDAVICISQAMMRWASQRYNVEQCRMHLVPCFVDIDHFAAAAHEREGARRELGIGDEFVATYCGSMLSWQLSAKSLEVLSIIRELRPDARFLGLTMHQERLRRLLREIGFPDDRTTILTVPHWQVPRYLAAADIGILGRGLLNGPDLVSEVSSPIKFGEYLACGTAVLMSEGIGDFSEVARRENVGAVLPHNASRDQACVTIGRLLDTYDDDREAIRDRCRTVAQRDLDIGPHVAQLADLYRDLALTGVAMS